MGSLFDDMKRKLDGKYKKEKDKKQESRKQEEAPQVTRNTGASASGNTGTSGKSTTPVLKGTNPFEDFRSRMEMKYNPNADIDDDYLGRFQRDAKGYLDRAQSDYDQMGSKSYESVFQSRLEATTDLQRRSSTIRNFLNRNKDRLDPKQYQSTIAYLDELGQAMDDSFSYFREANDAYKSLYGRSQETAEALGAEDFQDHSRYTSTRSDDWWERAWSQYSMGYNDLTYEYINNQGGIRDEINSKSRSYHSDLGGGSSFEDKHYDQMTDDEVAVYNYYYARDGKDRAEEYLDSIGATLEARANQETVKRVSKFAEEHPVISSALSVGTSLGSGSEYIRDVLTYGAEKLQGRDTSLGTNEAALMTNAVRGTVSEKVDWEIGNWDAFDFLYSTAMSGVDSMASAAFGSWGGAVLGLSAAAQATNDALDRGMSNGQAFWNGLVSGVFEGLFETASIGNFQKLKEVAPDSVKDIIKNLGKSMLVNASEETLTELANITYDTLINGDFANYTWEELKAGAWKDALLQVIEAGASGALMGVGMGGVGNAIGYFNGNRDAKQNYGEFQHDLVGEALQIDPENAYAQKMQERLDSGKDLRGGQLRKLVGQNEAAIAAHGDAAWESDAQEYGRMLETAEKGQEGAGNPGGQVATQTAKKAETERTVTLEEASGKYGAQAGAMVKTFREGQDVAKYDAAYKNAYDMGKSGVSMDYAKNSPSTAYLTAEQVELAYEAGTAAQNSFEASGEGKTLLQKDGSTVSIQGIESVSGGSMTLKLEDGRTVDASEVAFSSADEAMVYDAVAKMDLDGATAELLVGGYKTSGIPANAYAIGIRQAYRYGQKNFPKEDLNKAEYAAKLTEEQRTTAYEAGFAAAQAQVEKSAPKKATVAKNAQVGKVQFLDGGQATELRGYLQQKGRKLKAVQETAIQTMEKLSAAMGVDFYVFESYKKDGKRMYIDESGVEHSAPSGKYRSGSGAIYIDLNAGNQGQGIMLYTVAHELTHFIRDWSPAKFKTMADILMAGYAAEGQSVQELVDRQIAKAKRNGRTIDFDTAYEEVVADSMEAVLASGNVVQMMAEVKQQDQTLWQKICDWFRNLAADLKAVVDAYKGVAPDSREARLVADVEGFLDTLEMVYADALVDAGENYQAAGKAEKNTTQEGDVKMQMRTVDGNEVVWIEENILNENKGKPVHQFIANYIAEHIGEVYTIIESGQKVYIGEDLPGEYTQSKYTKAILRNNPNISRAKNRASANFGEMIEIATNRRWEKTKHPNSKDAKYGMYRYDTRFGFPVKNAKGTVTGANIFTAELLIRNASDGKKYLYDIVSIKKDIAASDWLTQRVTSAAGKPAGQKGDVSKKNVPQNAEEVKEKFALRDTVEETGELVAVHNLSPAKLLKTLKLGGLPMPSIAIARAKEGFNEFGEISLVFHKDTIDPEMYRRNKVYSGDAWTPVYPKVNYKVSDKVRKGVVKKIDSLVPHDIRVKLGRTMLDTDNLTSALDSNGGDVVEAFGRDDGLKYAFLVDKGVKLDIPMEEEPLDYYKQVSNEAVRYFSGKLANGLASLGYYQNMGSTELMADQDILEAVADTYNQEVLWTMKEGSEEYREYEKDPDFKPDNLRFSEVDTLLSNARKLLTYGTKQTVDARTAKKLIQEKTDQEGYEAWLLELFDGIVEKEGIRNNADYFTKSGNRRSFEALHYENNLENVIRVMMEQGDKGVSTFGGGNIFGAATTEYGSIPDIKRAADERLRTMNEDEYEQIKQGFSDRFFELANSLPNNKNSFSAVDDAANMLVEAVAKYKTKSGMANYLRRESKGWANYSDYVVDDLVQLVSEIRQMPVSYFEAKPQRAVGFDEIAAAVIPSVESLNDPALPMVKGQLEELGVPVIEYEYGDNGDRLNKLNEVEDVKFSDRDSDGNELSGEQQEYFRDSKVRDEQGRLLVMYHGTPNGGFTKFRSGTYFTQNPAYADVYQNPGASAISAKRSADAPMTYKVYLDIKKPFDTRKPKERRIFIQEYYRKRGTGAPLADSGLPDWTDGMDLQEFIEEMGYDYDGLILDEGATGGYGMEVKSRGLSYVTFSSEQVKNADNKAPTSDPDIRYSDRDFQISVDNKSSVVDNNIINRGEGEGRVSKANTDSEGNALSEEQCAFFAQSRARDGDGKLLVLYHGTANAGFTAFDPSKGRLGGNWFTTSRSDADSYAGNYQHKLFDPNERDDVRSAVGGSYMLGSWMRFDTEADREAFRKQYPAAESIKTDAEYEELMQKADDAGDYDEYERLEEEQLARRNALKQIQRAYGRYEWEHSREATLQELFDNPEQFTMSDVLRAWDTYDSNNSADEDGATKEELIEALRTIDQEGIEQGDDSIADIRFKARLPVDDSGQVVNRVNNRTYAVYVNAVNPYEIDARNQTLHGADLYPTIEASMKDNGYDSVIVRNARVGAHGETGDVVIIKDGGQVKLTSNKAPAEGADIRYSDRDPELEKVNEVLRRENTELRYDIAHLKELLKLQRQVTGGTKFTRSSVEAAAGQLMKYANARGDKKQLAGLLNDVYEYIAGGKELTWDGVKEAAQPAVDWLRTNVVNRKQRDSYAQDVLKEIRGSRIYLDEQQKQEVAYQYGSVNDFRKRVMGSVILTEKDAVSLDTKWQEWASLWPNIFDPETASNDMPAAMMEAFDSLRSMTQMDAYGYDEELFAQDLLSQVYDSYWRVSTLRTVADAKQKEINRLKAEHSKRMSNLRTFHKEKTAQLKAEHRESLQKVRQETWERTEKKLQEQAQRYQASREKAVCNRRKTEMRRKIRRTILDLDKLLNKGDKKRNVKEGMKDLVTEALRSADILFTDNYSNEDMIRNGVGTDLTEQEAKYLEEAKALMEQIGNLPSGSYEAFLERQEQETKLQGKLSYRMSKLQDVFARERARLAKAQVSEVLGNLADAYKSLEDSEFGYVSGAFHENVYQYLLAVKGEVGGTIVKDMSLSQLDDLHRAYTMVLTTVRNANRMFAQNLKQTREQLGSQTIAEIRKAGGEHGLWFPGEDKISTFSWNNQKPIYAFERIGSQTLKTLFENTRAGEDTWATDMRDARAFYLEQTRKHKYDRWDFHKQYKFTSTSGIDFSLNLEQIMSLYAYSKREQAHDHLMKGGFVFDGNTEVQVSKMGIKLTYLNKSAKAHNVSPDLLGQIVGKLTAEQKAFVDEMQDYLSTTMGEKGNSVSMELYGVKLFNEKHYFPLRSAGQYMERAKEADLKKQQGQISIVNSGFAKSTTPKASNPVVLSGFMDVWADHVNEMSMYHSFVLPMEDFRRVYNYASPNQETGQSVSVNSTIQDAYGEAATHYIDQLYRDLNGGAVSDPRETPAKSLMGKFKKAAVFASASVVVQQPSAIGRAFAIIDPKYFVGGKVGAKRHKTLWAELKQYAPVAAIKEMGYFDTGMGKSAQDYIKGKEYKGIKEKAAALFTDGEYRDELLGKAPALADELTWCAIWDAVKRETKAKNPRMDVKSEEFLKKAGQRFTEVVVKTQVYDSVLSRSANMRSKGAFMSMWTAFMAEPTTTINMMEDALRKGKRGDKQYAARATGAVLGSIILNSLLASLVYAMRDDDEDETFLEKYAQSFATEILDGINPLTYYPFLKDVWSALQGFDIERSDMSLITSLVEKMTKLVQVYGNDTEGMDEEELAAHGKNIANAWWGVVDYLTALVGIPVKNVRRDINGAFNTYSTISADLTDRDTSWGSLTDKVLGEVKNSIPVIGWLPDKTAADRLYEATVGGDTAYQKRLASSYRTENSLNNAIRKGLRANDSRIWEAAMAWNANELETYKRIAKEIVAEGHFSQDNVVAAIQAEAKAMMPQESESTSASKAKGYFTAEKFAVAISQGNSSMANAIQSDIVDTAMKNGKTREEAEKSFASSAKTEVKELFQSGSITQERAIKSLTDYCGKTREDAADAVNEWRAEKETGIVYDDIDDAFKAGKITEGDVRNMYVTYGGYTEKEATEKAATLAFVKKHPACEGISWAAIEEYTTKCEASGMKAETFWDAWKYNSSTKADVDENGESISGSKKIKVLAYINGLDLTSAQKDSLYYAFGWAESRIWEAPWH